VFPCGAKAPGGVRVGAGAEKGAGKTTLRRAVSATPSPRRPRLDAWVLAWNDAAVPRIAAAIYEDRRFDDLPILADALEEAGCTDAELQAHCRGGGEHARGCWAVDLVLAKE